MRLALASAIGVVLFFGSPSAFGQLAEVQIDFGKVTEAALANGQQTVSLKNTSDRTIVVDKVTAGCGCVQVAWSGPKQLVPGGTLETTARLDANAIRPGAFFYPVLAEIDGVQGQIGEVRFEYQPRILPSQRLIWLHSLDGLKHVEARFGVLTGGDTDISDIEVTVPSYITSELRRIDRQSGEITLTYRNSVVLRERKFSVLLRDPGSDDAPVQMTVFVPALDLVALDPAAVLFPEVKVSESASRSVRLRALTDQSLNIGLLEVVSDDARVKGALREADGALWLDVTICASETGVATSTLVLRDKEQTWSLPIPTTWRAK